MSWSLRCRSCIGIGESAVIGFLIHIKVLCLHALAHLSVPQLSAHISCIKPMTNGLTLALHCIHYQTWQPEAGALALLDAIQTSLIDTRPKVRMGG